VGIEPEIKQEKDERGENIKFDGMYEFHSFTGYIFFCNKARLGE
jgi:hypothetical protein